MLANRHSAISTSDLKIQIKTMAIKYPFIVYLLISPLLSNGQVNTTWKYHKLIIKEQNDSINLFNADSLHNMYSLEKIRITFKTDSTYEALFFNGQKKEGFWKIINNQMIVDSDTNLVVTQTSNFLRTEAGAVSVDMGYYITGNIITELTKIPDCSLLESLSSGNWNDPATWSCDRVPNKNDNVIIHGGHTITLSPAMGLHNCKNLTVETGGKFIENGKIYIKGN
jgi:hypothetical protein